MDREEHLKKQFVREARIGMALIGVTLAVFIVVVYSKTRGRFQDALDTNKVTMPEGVPTLSQATPPRSVDASVAALQAATRSVIDKVDPKAGDTSPTQSPPMPIPEIIKTTNPSSPQQGTEGSADGEDPSARITIKPLEENTSPGIPTLLADAPNNSHFPPLPTTSSTNKPKSILDRPPPVEMDKSVASASYESSAEQNSEPAATNEVFSKPTRAVRFVPGDSLWKIAQKQYGDGRWFRALAAHNRLDQLPAGKAIVGMDIYLPTTDQLKSEFPELAPDAPMKSTAGDLVTAPSTQTAFHVTKDGESLFSIARDRLGQASRFAEIIELNRDNLPAEVTSSTKLPSGFRLRLPEK